MRKICGLTAGLKLAALVLCLKVGCASAAPVLGSLVTFNEASGFIDSRPPQDVKDPFIAGISDVAGDKSILAVASSEHPGLIQNTALLAVQRGVSGREAAAGAVSRTSFWFMVQSSLSTLVSVDFIQSFSWHTSSPTQRGNGGTAGESTLQVGFSNDPRDQLLTSFYTLCSQQFLTECVEDRSTSVDNVIKLSTNTPYLIQSGAAVSTFPTGEEMSSASMLTRLNVKLVDSGDFALVFSDGVTFSIPEPSSLALLLIPVTALSLRMKRKR